MNSWFRLKASLVHNRKAQSLPAELFKTWVNLMCMAVETGGTVPPLTDVAYTLRLSESIAQKRLDALEQHHALDRDGDVLRIHGWDEHQFKSDSSTSRTRRYRERHRDVSCDGEGTSQPPSRDSQETSPQRHRDALYTDTEQNRGNGATSAPSAEAEFYRRGKEVLGRSSGGLLKKLLAAKGGNIALARAALEVASQKGDAGAYLGGVIRGEAERTRSGGWDGSFN